jgi:L-ascorbate metabolism protein UlaG (beta-lactamase superfamily)
MGFDPEKQTGYTKVLPGQTQTANGMEITAIESNDTGEGWFIKVDGLTILHPGDHANRNRDFSGPYKKEIDFLADKGLKADILFTPVSGCGFGDQIAVKKGAYYSIDRMSAKTVFPMHGDGKRFRDFADAAKAAGYEVPICCAMNAGDFFVVTPDGVKAAALSTIVCGAKGNVTTCP